MESSQNVNNKPHIRSTNACTIFKKCQRHNALSGSVRYWPWPMNLSSSDVLSFFQSVPLHLLTKSEVSVIERRKDILSEIKCNQSATGRLTIDLFTKNRYIHVASFFRFSFEYEVRCLKLHRFRVITLAKMFRLWVTLTLEKLTCFYASIPLVNIIPIPIGCTTR